jgi:hypothetical protein
MTKKVVGIVFIALSVFTLLSPTKDIVSSSPKAGDDLVCFNGTPLPYHTYLPLVIKDVNPIPNGDFELGHVAWTEYSSYSGNPLILNTVFPAGVSPHGGSWIGWLGHEWWYPPQDDYIYQTITIPTGKPILHIWYWIQSLEPDSYHDTFQVLFYDVDPIVNWPLYTGTNTSGWAELAVDLRAYTCITATLQFYTHNDWNDASYIFLDDISLQAD